MRKQNPELAHAGRKDTDGTRYDWAKYSLYKKWFGDMESGWEGALLQHGFAKPEPYHEVVDGAVVKVSNVTIPLEKMRRIIKCVALHK